MLKMYLNDLITLYKRENLVDNCITLLFYNVDIQSLVNELKKISIIDNYKIEYERNLKLLELKFKNEIDLNEFNKILKILDTIYIVEIYQCKMTFELLHKIKDKTITTSEILIEINLSQSEISKSTGIPRNKLNDFIKGRRKVNIDIINSIYSQYPLIPAWDIFNCPK
ncbi:hypothetical protein HMPREF1092_03215 [Clostridium thermobutyricum]|uniref:Uncharacterized protein n=2 Tax=Clostridium thermobutyricum TaxID=29372 RepID=N9W999_9CLOT|nr:transcriptional regulator [Clostridium thermobutyricum]ENY99474.1 hypothetical protein HMPREF1092_03215 [Clostridium thermobutyricum]